MPRRLNSILREHPSVKDAALIGKPDKTWGEVGLMIVVLDDGTSITEDELKGFCRERLARLQGSQRNCLCKRIALLGLWKGREGEVTGNIHSW